MKVEPYYASLNALMVSLSEMEQAYDPIIAFHFNSLNFFNVGETVVSKILAYFLDPNEKHGQGDTFLKAFLEDISYINIPPKLDQVIVTAEFDTGNGYLDILISLGNGSLIGIENKCWDAIDQQQQLERYRQYLESATQKHQNYTLVYMPSENYSPSEDSMSSEKQKASIESGNLLCYPFSDRVIPLLEKWASFSRSHRVSNFLNELALYFKEQYFNEQFMGTQNKIIEFATKPENIETTLTLIEQKDKILTKLTTQFVNNLTQEAHNEGFIRYMNWDDAIRSKDNVMFVDEGFERGDLYTGFYFKKKDWINIHVTFAFGKGGRRNFYFGIGINNKLTKPYRDILENAFMDAYRSEDVPVSWWFIEKDWDSETYKKILSGQLVSQVIQQLKKLAKQIEDINQKF